MTMDSIELLLSLPWTICPVRETYRGETSVELTVAELPDFTVCARSATEVERAFWPALRLFLESYLDEGEIPPLPAAVMRALGGSGSDDGGAEEPEEVDIDVLLGIDPRKYDITTHADEKRFATA